MTLFADILTHLGSQSTKSIHHKSIFLLKLPHLSKAAFWCHHQSWSPRHSSWDSQQETVRGAQTRLEHQASVEMAHWWPRTCALFLVALPTGVYQRDLCGYKFMIVTRSVMSSANISKHQGMLNFMNKFQTRYHFWFKTLSKLGFLYTQKHAYKTQSGRVAGTHGQGATT